MSTGEQPDPSTIRTVDDVAGYLRQLRAWAGWVSYPELIRRINRTRDPRAHARQTTVYDCFRPGRKRLDPDLVLEIAAALGLDEPGRTRLRQAITSAHRESPRTARPARVPRQLPASPQMFTGRASELAVLDHGPDASTVVITAIDGMAGVGKTALAVHAAHRLADRYPDGQLFIDLHGYTEGVPPVDPLAALDRLLRSLGVAGEHVPADLDERAALYRSRTAGRRMLILLDNTATEDQVAPLLPGSPGCLVLVTSRRRLAGLEQTHTLSLDILPPADAVVLFTDTVGAGRLRGTPPELLAEAVDLCGRLPLAIRLAAARLRSHATWDLTNLIERIRDHRNRLAELAAGPRSVTAALDLSYQQVTGEQQRLYRLLGLHPGREVDPYAAAALAGVTAAEAQRQLDQLLDTHLLQEPIPGRYRFHDLIRDHAIQTGRIADTEPDRRAAVTRLLDYYRHTAAVAMDAAYPFEHERRPAVPPADTSTPALAGPTEAVAWLDAELANLLDAARQAAGAWPGHALHLSAILHRHLHTRGSYRDAEILHARALRIARATGRHCDELTALLQLGRTYQPQGLYDLATSNFAAALEIARGTGDRTGEQLALIGLGDIDTTGGRFEKAIHQGGQALEIAHGTGDRTGELEALLVLGHAHRRQGQHQHAADHYARALAIARTTGHSAGELASLLGLGHVHWLQGRREQAVDHYQQALEIARAVGHRTGELHALRGLGNIHRMEGRYESAAGHFGQARTIARTIGSRHGELSALVGLGHVHRRRGQHEQATDSYQQALDLAQEISSRNWQFEAAQGLGRLHCAAGRPDVALTQHQGALHLATELGQPDDLARAHDGLAHAHRALNQPERARQHWQRALDILAGVGTDHTEEEEASVPAIRAHLAGLGQKRRPQLSPG